MHTLRLFIALALSGLLFAACAPAEEPTDDAHVALDGATPDGGDPEIDAGRDASARDTGLDGSEPDAGVDAAIDAAMVDAAMVDTDAGLATGHVRGRVVEALTLDTVAIAGAVVSDGHGASATTDADGAFDLTGLHVGPRVSLHVEPPRGATVFATTELLVDVPATGDVRADARLLRGCATVVDLGAGERARPLAPCGSRGARVGVELPAGGVLSASGAPVTRARMEIAAIPSLGGGDLVGEAFLAFPGDLTAIDARGLDVWLESRGAAEVRLFDDATGEPAHLAPGAEATLVLPAAPTSIEDDAVRVWSYDVAARAWVEEGSGVVDVDAASGSLVTRMTVPHFSWWNSDQPATRTCLSGRIEITSALSLANVTVATIGVDYSGSTSARIAADGTFEVLARSASTVDLTTQYRLGPTTRAVQSARISTGATGVCTDVGVVRIDTSGQIGCARGRAEDAFGAPVANADITATHHGRVITARSGADGSFCVPLVGDVPAIVRGEGTSAGGAPLRGEVRDVRATGGSVCGGACTDLGTLVLHAASCVTGTITDLDGPVLGALVSVDGASTGAHARSAADGTYCAVVAAGARYEAYGLFRTGGVASSADARHFFVPETPGSCGEPSTCVRVDLHADDVSCVHGVAIDVTGAPVAGATVRARPHGSTRFGRAETAADGSFCVPARTGEEVNVEVVREEGTRRLYAAQTTNVVTGAAVCGGTGCRDIGDVVLQEQVFRTCIRGRLLDDGEPVRLPIEAWVADQVAVVRTRDDGRFCLDVDPGPTMRVGLRDPNRPPLPRCVGDRDTSFIVEPAPGISCADETACEDLGDVDFAAFCAGS